MIFTKDYLVTKITNKFTLDCLQFALSQKQTVYENLPNYIDITLQISLLHYREPRSHNRHLH